MRTLSYPLLLVASLLAPGALRAQNAGDAARGKAIVEGKGGCLSCHRIKDVGSTFGPDLSEIGSPGRGGGGGAAGGAAAPSREMQLQTSLLDPSAEIAPTQRSYRVVTKAG